MKNEGKWFENFYFDSQPTMEGGGGTGDGEGEGRGGGGGGGVPESGICYHEYEYGS